VRPCLWVQVPPKTWSNDDKELFLECEARVPLTFNQFYLLGKALVCSCREEYEQCMLYPARRMGYYNVYWCTHGYSTTARTKFLLHQVCARETEGETENTGPIHRR